MNDAFVLDASVTMSWFLEDETTTYGEEVKAAALKGARLVVPSLWPIETTNVLLRAERGKRLSPSKALEALSLLKALPVEIDDAPSREVFSEGWTIGRAHRLSAYDAMYLALCLRRGLPLATLDQPLQKAAHEAGVTLFLK